MDRELINNTKKPTIFPKVVPVEIAALMKAKGFDWKIKEFYMYTPKATCINSSGGYKDHYSSYIAYSNSEWAAMYKDVKCFWKGIDDKHPNISAPTYDMTIDWLLEKGYYVMAVLVRDNGKDSWTYSYNDFNVGEEFLGKKSDKMIDRYTALNKGIMEVLKKL